MDFSGWCDDNGNGNDGNSAIGDAENDFKERMQSTKHTISQFVYN